MSPKKRVNAYLACGCVTRRGSSRVITACSEHAKFVTPPPSPQRTAIAAVSLAEAVDALERLHPGDGDMVVPAERWGELVALARIVIGRPR